MTTTSEPIHLAAAPPTKRLRRPLPKVMQLTDAAAARIRDIMANTDKPLAGVRVGVKNGGCAGMEYTLEYAEQRNALDELVEDKGVQILVDPKAVLFLLGTTMDFEAGKMKSGFVFRNPNQTSACGCGESVAITPAEPDLDGSPSAV
jgi:iron-sulfur cluster assembly protein